MPSFRAGFCPGPAADFGKKEQSGSTRDGSAYQKHPKKRPEKCVVENDQNNTCSNHRAEWKEKPQAPSPGSRQPGGVKIREELVKNLARTQKYPDNQEHKGRDPQEPGHHQERDYRPLHDPRIGDVNRMSTATCAPEIAAGLPYLLELFIQITFYYLILLRGSLAFTGLPKHLA